MAPGTAKPPSIRLLASTNNARGDLFTRLVRDLFFALGYDDLRLNVHKSGRELDIQGMHRREPRRIVAECKAHAKKMGGDVLNKFFGALTRERTNSKPMPVAGYFVSLGGFTETGIEQENETGDDAIILLDAPQVIAELERSGVLVDFAKACERAGHCAEHAGLSDAVLDGGNLLGHERGYLWGVYYSQGKKRTHFALIHADGTPLAESVAREVVEADRKCRGSLHSLRYLAPPRSAQDRAAIVDTAVERYRQWLEAECGYIQLDGLPADADLSATRLKLERLFVPLKLIVDQPHPEAEDADPRLSEAGSEGRPSESQPQPVGHMLVGVPHLALLAAPGGGKSTLLKRLAVAYACPDRRAEIADGLPKRDWLPIFLRCRELRDRAHRPILELLDDLPRHAGMSGVEAANFCELAHEALRAGRAILLVDGLDEISDEGARQTFAQHLRTFLAMFPQAAMIVTSREAGFRLVAGVIASACTRVNLAPFDEDDVQQLCDSWHLEVVGNNDKVRSDARDLARMIWGNARIRVLAENPLLLTTLLVVKRCVGELPRNRAGLYREAIRVLIRTWNVEGYMPLDEGEAMAQLSYVACAMMEKGVQQIGHEALHKLLKDARQELEAELQFAAISATEFIERIEYRSSLLMQIGHTRIEGKLQPLYEFRHLTFQEYLAARGYVEEQYPGRDAAYALANLLEPHFEDQRWCEVIPLAAVLAGRKAEDIVKRLTRACEELSVAGSHLADAILTPHVSLLRQCLLDEVQVTSPTLRSALQQMARHGGEEYLIGSIADLRRGKFGVIFQEVAEKAYIRGGDGFVDYHDGVKDLAMEAVSQNGEPMMARGVCDTLARALAKGDCIEKVRAAMVCMKLAYTARGGDSGQEFWERFELLRDGLAAMLDPHNPPAAMAAIWALAWIGGNRLTNTPPQPAMILSLYRIWREAEPGEYRRFAGWALSVQPLLSRDTFNHSDWGECDTWLREAISDEGRASDEAHDPALVVAWYRRAPLSDSELVREFGKSDRRPSFRPTTREILETLGKPGRRVLERWDKKRQEVERPE